MGFPFPGGNATHSNRNKPWVTIARALDYTAAVEIGARFLYSRVYSPGGAISRPGRAVGTCDISVDVPYGEIDRSSGNRAGIEIAVFHEP